MLAQYVSGNRPLHGITCQKASTLPR